MSSETDIWSRFIEFEKRHKLFDITDGNGVHVWDIVRFDIYIGLLWDKSGVTAHSGRFSKAFTQVLRGFSLLRLLCTRNKDYLFFINSRNKIDGRIVDQNAYGAIKTLPPEKITLIESSHSDVKQDRLIKRYRIPSFRICRLFMRVPVFDFTQVIDLIKLDFPDSDVSQTQLTDIYQRFYVERSLYRSVLRKTGARKVFITQNGIQKGLIAAARDLGLGVYEFQHGIVDDGHLAYSFPRSGADNRVYLPHKIASLSDFWFRDCFMPGDVKIVPAGNDYFNIAKLPDPGKNHLLIISSSVMGTYLMRFLSETLSEGSLAEYRIYFKLHPDEFAARKAYEEHFSGYNNVEVVTNEFNVPQLLEKCDTLFTIQSTAVYEALQAGRKVVLLKESSYTRHSHLFGCANVHLVASGNEFLNALSAEIKNITENFFVPFNERLFKEEFIDE